MKSVTALVLCMGLAVPLAQAQAAGNAEAGHALARQWCSACHIVDQPGLGKDTAPPFAEIARRNRQDRGWVRVWLMAPHPPMANINLSRQQIDDVIAYLDSLSAR